MELTFQEKQEIGVALSKHLADMRELLPNISNERGRKYQQDRIEAVTALQVKLQRLNP
ncbi:hypothetical protein WJU23_05370 [Prosthecobacter sp. SYSU 5D2]|uniref:hypothetical protein n=1 Tax=Prosthecobacter sp. SYSU 5D2 TaxID=3134134 RepID=UPI0031FEE0D3